MRFGKITVDCDILRFNSNCSTINGGNNCGEAFPFVGSEKRFFNREYRNVLFEVLKNGLAVNYLPLSIININDCAEVGFLSFEGKIPFSLQGEGA